LGPVVDERSETLIDGDLIFLLRTFLILALFFIVMLYGVVYIIGVWFPIGDRLKAYFPPAFWIALCSILVLIAISFTAFELIANSYRFAGVTSTPLPEDKQAIFMTRSRNTFFMLYAGIILVSGAVGILLRRWRQVQGWGTSAALVLAVVLFLGLTFRHVKYLNSC
jgi:hypothetical protein